MSATESDDSHAHLVIVLTADLAVSQSRGDRRETRLRVRSSASLPEPPEIFPRFKL
jgi:hypothetical protein